jgi:hypothetical protein
VCRMCLDVKRSIHWLLGKECGCTCISIHYPPPPHTQTHTQHNCWSPQGVTLITRTPPHPRHPLNFLIPSFLLPWQTITGHQVQQAQEAGEAEARDEQPQEARKEGGSGWQRGLCCATPAARPSGALAVKGVMEEIFCGGGVAGEGCLILEGGGEGGSSRRRWICGAALMA